MTVHYKYPHIGNFKKMVKQLEYYKHLPEELTFSGTVKLHGTHADIVQNINKDITIQSRNRIITLENDNIEFVSFIEERSVNKLFDKIRNKIECEIIMISGEFCGKKVQNGVAISTLARFFVIFDIFLNGKWQNMADFNDIYDEDNRIFNIMSYPTYEIKVLKSDIASTIPIIDEYTDKIGKECPVAKCFGIEGQGEGLVWKCCDSNSADMWFKSKAIEFSKIIVKPIKVVDEKINIANEFASKYVTEDRLLQGIDYLIEFKIAIDISTIGTFSKWVVEDIIREHGNEIDDKLIPIYRKEITNIVIEWYKNKIYSNIIQT